MTVLIKQVDVHCVNHPSVVCEPGESECNGCKNLEKYFIKMLPFKVRAMKDITWGKVKKGHIYECLGVIRDGKVATCGTIHAGILLKGSEDQPPLMVRELYDVADFELV